MFISAGEWVERCERAAVRSSAACRAFFDLPEVSRPPTPEEELEARRELRAETVQRWRRRVRQGLVGSRAEA